MLSLGFKLVVELCDVLPEPLWIFHNDGLEFLAAAMAELSATAVSSSSRRILSENMASLKTTSSFSCSLDSLTARCSCIDSWMMTRISSGRVGGSISSSAGISNSCHRVWSMFSGWTSFTSNLCGGSSMDLADLDLAGGGGGVHGAKSPGSLGGFCCGPPWLTDSESITIARVAGSACLQYFERLSQSGQHLDNGGKLCLLYLQRYAVPWLLCPSRLLS